MKMRFFGLYFGLFSTLFYFLFKQDFLGAVHFGSSVLFYYFVFTTALSSAFAIAMYAAFKKGFDALLKFSLFNGLLAGGIGAFAINFTSNRTALLFGSHLLSEGVSKNDLFLVGFGGTLLILGYSVFRPFNFDFFGGGSSFKRETGNESPKYDETIIDVDVADYDKKGIGRD